MIKLILSLFLSVNVYASIPPSPQEQAYLLPSVGTNYLSNPSLENGLIGVTASTSGIATLTSNAIDGNYGLQIDTSGAQSVNIGKSTAGRLGYNTNLFANKNCVASLYYRVPSTPSSTISVTVKKVSDDSDLSSSTTLTSTGSNWLKLTIPFLCDSSSAAYINIATSAAEIAFYVDQVFIGTTVISQISQASFVGSSHFATTASCAWDRTNTAIGAFGTDTDCPGPTIDFQNIGSWQTTDADLPRQTINNLPAGYYIVVATLVGNNNATLQSIDFSITDGTTTSGTASCTNSSSVRCDITVVGSFSYSASGNRTFEIYGSADSNTVTLDNSGVHRQLIFTVWRFPTSGQTAYSPDQTPASWSGTLTGAGGGWATTSSSYTDASVATTSTTLTEFQNRNFGTVVAEATKLPGITFTPPRAGAYLICAQVPMFNTSDQQVSYARLSDGSGNAISGGQGNASSGASGTVSITLCGTRVLSAASTTIKIQIRASANTATINQDSNVPISWSLVQLDAPMPTPFLAGSVTSNSSGIERLERVRVVYSGGTPTVNSQSGSWVSSLTDNGTGDYTIVIPAGIFSAAPVCVCTPGNDVVNGGKCEQAAAPTSTAVRFRLRDSSNTLTDENSTVLCMGQR